MKHLQSPKRNDVKFQQHRAAMLAVHCYIAVLENNHSIFSSLVFVLFFLPLISQRSRCTPGAVGCHWGNGRHTWHTDRTANWPPSTSGCSLIQPGVGQWLFKQLWWVVVLIHQPHARCCRWIRTTCQVYGAWTTLHMRRKDWTHRVPLNMKKS